MNLKELIGEINKVFDAGDGRICVEEVQALLESYKSNAKDWKQFAHFDPHRYTRNLVDEGNGRYNLMALCWGEGHGSSIHDHADSHCFVKILDGTLRETLFDWPSDSEEETGMSKRGETDFKRDGVTYMCDELGLHRMENPSNSERTVSLHLYCPPFGSCQTFDERTGHCNKVDVTFWSKYGKRTPFTTNSCAAPPENN